MSTLFKPFAMMFFLFCVGWLGYVMIATDRDARLDRSCQPVHSIGTLIESVTGLVSMSAAETVHEYTATTATNCRFVVWRQFFDNSTNYEPQSAKDNWTNRQDIEEKLAQLKKQRDELTAKIKKGN